MTRDRKSHDKNLPVWFDGQSINEALFCEEFLQQRKIIFANRAFFTPDGRVTDELMLRGEIYERLKGCVVSNIPRKISNIMEVLKLEAQVNDFPPEPGKIHLDNGTLFLDGTFFGRKAGDCSQQTAGILQSGCRRAKAVAFFFRWTSLSGGYSNITGIYWLLSDSQ